MGWLSKLLKVNQDNYSENDIDNLQKKALEGDVDAQFDLAVKYTNGDGVEQNYQKAINLYIPLSEKDVVSAHNLALIYCSQYGQKEEYFDKGLNLFVDCSKKGYGQSCSELMKLLIIGFNVEQNHNGSIYYMYQAIKNKYYKVIDEYYKAVGMVKNIGLSKEDAIHILESNSANAVSIERQIITDRTSSSLRWRIKQQSLLDIDGKKIDKIEVEFDDESPIKVYYFDISRAFEE